MQINEFDDLEAAIEEAIFCAEEEQKRYAIISFNNRFGVITAWQSRLKKIKPLEIIRPTSYDSKWFKKSVKPMNTPKYQLIY
ncbi:MAG: hypothetical protein IBX55_13040 [Methyloprofundus sp.]|nr:hypothetical protein [Methyloprofundus sp.]